MSSTNDPLADVPLSVLGVILGWMRCVSVISPVGAYLPSDMLLTTRSRYSAHCEPDLLPLLRDRDDHTIEPMVTEGVEVN